MASSSNDLTGTLEKLIAQDKSKNSTLRSSDHDIRRTNTIKRTMENDSDSPDTEEDSSDLNNKEGTGKKAFKKQPWSGVEDSMLKAIIAGASEGIDKDGKTIISLTWSEIADIIPHRTPKQCRERWTYNLDPSINHGPWTLREDAVMLKTHQQFRNQWALIARYLPGRTENAVKTRYKSVMRAKKRQFKPEEDQKIRDLYQCFGSKWSQLQQHFPNRTANALKTRFSVLRRGMNGKKPEEVGSPKQIWLKPELIKSINISCLLKKDKAQLLALQFDQNIDRARRKSLVGEKTTVSKSDKSQAGTKASDSKPVQEQKAAQYPGQLLQIPSQQPMNAQPNSAQHQPILLQPVVSQVGVPAQTFLQVSNLVHSQPQLIHSPPMMQLPNNQIQVPSAQIQIAPQVLQQLQQEQIYLQQFQLQNQQFERQQEQQPNFQNQPLQLAATQQNANLKRPAPAGLLNPISKQQKALPTSSASSTVPSAAQVDVVSSAVRLIEGAIKADKVLTEKDKRGLIDQSKGFLQNYLQRKELRIAGKI